MAGVAARSWSSARRIFAVIGIPRQVRDAVMSVAYMSVRQLRVEVVGGGVRVPV